MVYYRYQNTKKLERNSQYVDMKALYNEVIYRRDNQYKDIKITVDFLVEQLYDEFSQELKYRKNLSRFQYKSIIRNVCEIAINNELPNFSDEEKRKQRIEAHKEIDSLMKNYPLNGIFVVPEYSEEFKNGTTYSIPELRSKVITNLNVPSAKYLAIYKGEVIEKEMIYGGTLIMPTKILGVLSLYENANKYNHINVEAVYRHLKNQEDLKDAISIQKEILLECQKNSFYKSLKNKIANAHIRELIIIKLLNLVDADYQNLEYRFIDNKHIIDINKSSITYRYCIFDKDVTTNNILNNDNIQYNGYCIVDDYYNNTQKRESLNMTIAV